MSLRGTADFRRALHQGARFSDGMLALRALKCEETGGGGQGGRNRAGRRDEPAANRVRLGISVGKRFGGAVQRNRVRRRMREVVRAAVARGEGAWDLVLMPQAAARTSTYDQLRTSIERLLRRAGVHAEGE